jgi:nucleotide-binding universal stress UspA family protein
MVSRGKEGTGVKRRVDEDSTQERNPSVQILKASKGFDLIVMGGRGHGVSKVLARERRERFVNNSNAPVLIVRPK